MTMTRRSPEGDVTEFRRVSPAEVAEAIAAKAEGETLDFCEVGRVERVRRPVIVMAEDSVTVIGPRSGLWIGGGR